MPVSALPVSSILMDELRAASPRCQAPEAAGDAYAKRYVPGAGPAVAPKPRLPIYESFAGTITPSGQATTKLNPVYESRALTGAVARLRAAARSQSPRFRQDVVAYTFEADEAQKAQKFAAELALNDQRFDAVTSIYSLHPKKRGVLIAARVHKPAAQVPSRRQFTEDAGGSSRHEAAGPAAAPVPTPPAPRQLRPASAPGPAAPGPEATPSARVPAHTRPDSHRVNRRLRTRQRSAGQMRSSSTSPARGRSPPVDRASSPPRGEGGTAAVPSRFALQCPPPRAALAPAAAAHEVGTHPAAQTVRWQPAISLAPGAAPAPAPARGLGEGGTAAPAEEEEAAPAPVGPSEAASSTAEQKEARRKRQLRAKVRRQASSPCRAGRPPAHAAQAGLQPMPRTGASVPAPA